MEGLYFYCSLSVCVCVYVCLFVNKISSQTDAPILTRGHYAYDVIPDFLGYITKEENSETKGNLTVKV